MERSSARLRAKRVDLMQVHNLVDVDTQLATMRAWKEQGRYSLSRHHAYVRLRPSRRSKKSSVAKKLDFLQINYSIIDRAADERCCRWRASARRGADQPPFCKRRSLRAGALETIARMGGGI